MLLLRKIQNAKRKGIIFEKLYGAENNFGQELQRFFDEKRSSKQYAVHKKMHALAGADLGGGGGGGGGFGGCPPSLGFVLLPILCTILRYPFLVTDLKIFLKAPSASIYINFEGGARAKKKRNFLVISACFFFSKLCLRRRNFGQNRVFVLL